MRTINVKVMMKITMKCLPIIIGFHLLVRGGFIRGICSFYGVFFSMATVLTLNICFWVGSFEKKRLSLCRDGIYNIYFVWSSKRRKQIKA